MHKTVYLHLFLFCSIDCGLWLAWFCVFFFRILLLFMNSAYISSVAAFIPPDTLSNYDLEQMVDTTDEWIKTRTGIENRHILRGEGLATSDMVIPVIQGICAEKNLDPEEIDCLIVATTTPDYFSHLRQIYLLIKLVLSVLGVLIFWLLVVVLYMHCRLVVVWFKVGAIKR